MVAGVRMRAPMMHIHTVAAGGGSILHFDGGRFRVGPDSAGADPGPGLLSSRRSADRDRLQCSARPDPGRAGSRRSSARGGSAAWIGRWSAANSRSWPERSPGNRAAPGSGRKQVAEGFLRIAVENMANAIKKISVQRGHDVTELHPAVLRRGGRPACLPGGRSSRHAADLPPPLAGVLSAYGMGLADIRTMREVQLEHPFASPDLAALLTIAVEPLKTEACREVREQGIPRRRSLRTARSTCAMPAPIQPWPSILRPRRHASGL